MADEANGLRAALEKAYDSQMGTDTPEPAAEPQVEATPEPTPDAPAPERARDEAGRFARENKPDEPQTGTNEPVKAKPPEIRKAPLTAADTQPVQPDAPQQAVRAPASWRPSEREAWGQVPKAAQEAIARREREIEAGMREASDARQNWSRFQEVVEPFRHIMLANGSTDPVQSAQNLFRTAAVLQTGTPYQKAGMLAQVMAQFDIDPRMVAAYVTGQMPQGGVPQQGQPPMDPRVDQLLARLEQAKAQKQQAFESRMAQTIEEFSSKAEWFDDVREQMADIIDLWDRQGKVNESNLTEAIKNAYDMAVQMNPDIAQAMRQRQQVSQVQTAQANVQRAQNAASSVRGQPTVGGTTPPKDRREALERAYDAKVNRRA